MAKHQESFIWELYERRAPIWIRCIRWRDISKRFIAKNQAYLFALYAPLLYVYYLHEEKYALRLYLKRPTTDEERLAMKRNLYPNLYTRDYELGQFQHNVAPFFDLSERRKKYPQYYGDKYNQFRRDGHELSDIGW